MYTYYKQTQFFTADRTLKAYVSKLIFGTWASYVVRRQIDFTGSGLWKKQSVFN